MVFLAACAPRPGGRRVTPLAPKDAFFPDKLAAMDEAVAGAIAEGKCPGGVLWLEHDGAVYSKAYGERAKVQPGNNAPMWRSVGGGVTGYSSLPKSEAPEAGNLIQPMVQYPGSRLTSAGEAWRQVRNNWLIPYGGSLLLIALVIPPLFTDADGRGLQDRATGTAVVRR